MAFLYNVFIFISFCTVSSHLFGSTSRPFGPISGVLGQNQVDFDWESLQPAENLTWTDCYTGLNCAKLNVPLDYSNSSSGYAVIAIIRVPSQLSPSEKNYRGPILFNPGGPGGSGIDMIVESGGDLATVVGPEFDFVSFDPRGIGRSTPRVSFFSSPQERALWDFSPRVAVVEENDIPRMWARAQALGLLAQQQDNGALKHVTTDDVARDMLSIVEAYGQTKLQYWGISYGTVLGATFATLFPDKVERLMIDGVLDMDSYFSVEWSNELLDTDKTMQTFFDGCHAAGPEICPFYASTPAKISKKLTSLYNSVRAQPVPVFDPSTSSYGLVDYATLKLSVKQAVYSPYSLYPTLAQGLSDLASGNGSIIFQMFDPRPFECQCDTSPKNPDYDNEVEAETAVSCGDGVQIHDDASDLVDYYHSIKNVSSFVDILLFQRISCSGWKVHSENHFTGPVSGNTSFPILLIGNTADPVTPLTGAKKTSGSFTGSVVLTQDSPGHTSLAAPSLCTWTHIRQYFQNGTLPDAGKVCAVDVDLFASSTNLTSRGLGTMLQSRTALKLLEAGQAISRAFGAKDRNFI